MSAQLTLLDAPPPAACDKTFEDLVGEVCATGRLPLWAQLAGEAWFARAYAACRRERRVARLAHAAFGRDVYDEDDRWWETDCEECRGGDDECAACAELAREVVGPVTLEMVRVGLELRRAKGGAR